MPNIATVFKAEITRLARKEAREEAAALKKAVGLHRTEIAGLKRRIATLEGLVRKLTTVERAKPGPARSPRSVETLQPKDARFRFRPQGLATNRKRLGLSASDFGLLVGTTGQSIYAWEAGKATPRPQALAAIVALRGVGKREAARRLAGLKGE